MSAVFAESKQGEQGVARSDESKQGVSRSEQGGARSDESEQGVMSMSKEFMNAI